MIDNTTKLNFIECYDLPNETDDETIYRLLPKNPSDKFYSERTDRNIGWITKSEQELLRHSTVGIAGCGGMGGLVAATLLRLGVGEIRIADCEVFDESNINRQFAAMRTTIDSSKAFETAKLLRLITDDTTITVYPQGINEDTVEHFLNECDLVCDMIEFWAIGARILLHKIIREKKITLLNCDTVGFRTNIFRFTHDSMRVEEALGFEYEKAKILQSKIQTKNAPQSDIQKVMDSVIKVFGPEIPEYFPNSENGNVVMLEQRLFEEGRLTIIATNPPMASGFLSDRILFELLRDSGTNRSFVEIPKMPGYLAFDAALMKTWIVNKQWWK